MPGKMGHAAAPSGLADKQVVEDDDLEPVTDDLEDLGMSDDPEGSSIPEIPDLDDSADEPDESAETDEEAAVEEPGEPDAGESAPETSGEADAVAASPERPDYLPASVDWEALPLEQKLLLESAYGKGRESEASKLTAEERAILERVRSLDSTTADTATTRQRRRLDAPKIKLPDDYDSDPALKTTFDQVNAVFQQQTDLNNALIDEVYELRDGVQGVGSSHAEMVQQQKWATFTAAHPDAADPKVVAEMQEQMSLLNPRAPIEKMWDAAYRMTGRTGAVKKKTAAREQEDVANAVDRGRAIRAANVASTRSGRRASGQLETPESSLEGLSYEQIYALEKKNGTLPSQRR